MKTWLQLLLMKKRFSQTRLANLLGISGQHMHYICTGKRTPSEAICCKLAEILQEPLSEVLLHLRPESAHRLGIASAQLPEPQAHGVAVISPGICNCPILGTVSAGPGCGYYDDPPEKLDHLPILTRYLTPGRNYFCVRVSGDSMNRDDIRHGDLLIVEREHNPKNVPPGKIVVVSHPQDGVMCKRFRKVRGGVELVSSNLDFPPIPYVPGDLKLEGIVRQLARLDV